MVFHQNNANGIANSEDPDQTPPPLGAVCFGSALFAQTYLSENLGSLGYPQSMYRETLILWFFFTDFGGTDRTGQRVQTKLRPSTRRSDYGP